VQATIFGRDIQLPEDILSTLKKYFITNALVTPIKPEHRIVNNEYQWTKQLLGVGNSEKVNP
jgi:hypothetical protein